MERLTYWNCKEKNSEFPVAINDMGDTVSIEDICAKLAAYEDAGLEPESFQAAMQEFANHLKEYTYYRNIGTVEEIKANMEIFASYRHVCGGLPPERVVALIEAEQKRRDGCKND